MDFAPARIGSERADGTMQWSEMGPASYWPEWIPEIADARLTIVSYDLASDGYPASGMGDLNPGIPFAQLQARYGSQLERDGWDAAFWYQNTTFGTLPPPRCPHLHDHCAQGHPFILGGIVRERRGPNPPRLDRWRAGSVCGQGFPKGEMLSSALPC